MENFLDPGLALSTACYVVSGAVPRCRPLEESAAALPPSQAAIVRAVAAAAAAAMDSALPDLLFALRELADRASEIELRVDGVDAATLSDGLYGEVFGLRGWRSRSSGTAEDGSTTLRCSADGFAPLRTSQDLAEQRRAGLEPAPLHVWFDVVDRSPALRKWVAHNKTAPNESPGIDMRRVRTVPCRTQPARQNHPEGFHFEVRMCQRADAEL